MYSAGGDHGRVSPAPKDGTARPAPPTGGGGGPATRAPARFRLVRNRQPKVGVNDATHRGHHYSAEEQAKLASFQSISYLPLHTKIYAEWLKAHWTNREWDHWIMMAIVGLVTGFAGALLKNLVQFFTKLKFMHVQDLINRDLFGLMWFYVVSVSVLLAFGAAVVIVYFEPVAAGSGVPETISYLNGVSIPKFFSFRTLVAKYVSVALTVASGLFGGNEGPMIAIGASLGKVLSQGTQLRNGCTTALFKRFRNMYDRRNFISAGAAAGVASAFGAPVGGLLFVLEEVSSFWSHKLAWQTFFCCMISTITTQLITNSFEAFEFTGEFGLFTNERSYAFFVGDVAMKSQIKMFGPVMILGVLGGLAGAGFTWLNLKLMKFRNRWIARIPWRRVTEVVAVAFVTTTLTVLLPAAFPCLPVGCADDATLPGCNARLASSGVEAVASLHRYTCGEGSYNPAASLLFVSGDKTIGHLLTRNTHYQFDYAAVITLLLFYFVLACYTAGMAQASGIMVPSLLIGSALGRLFGLMVTDIAGGVHQGADNDWIDPGVFALIGAAAFFGGVTRLTMSLTVIMIELTNDTHFLLPLMLAVIVAKLTADSTMDSLYHCLMQLKCLPYLSDELHAQACLELHSVSEIMSAPAVSLPLFGPVAEVARKLAQAGHSAFPVVEPGLHGDVFKGVILRNHVICILAREDLFVDPPTGTTPKQQPLQQQPQQQQPPPPPQQQQQARSKSPPGRQVSFQLTEQNKDKYIGVLDQGAMANLDDKLPKVQISDTDTGDREALIERLATTPEYERRWVNLSPYVDQSSVAVPDTFSVERGYNLFRTMGLRHITVVDKKNSPVGVLSRKDLLPLNVEEKVEKAAAANDAQGAADAGRESSAEALDRSDDGRDDGGRTPINAGNKNSSGGGGGKVPKPFSPVLR